MLSAAYYGHIHPSSHEFRLEHQTPHSGMTEDYYRLRFGAPSGELIVYLTDTQLAEMVSAINKELAERLAAKGVEFVEPPLLKVPAAAANYQEDVGGNPDPERP